MSFILRPAQRSCVASRVQRISARAARESLLHGADVQRGFVHFATPMPAFDDTAFRVMADRRELIVAVHLANSMGPRSADDSIEIFIDPLHDHLGFFQFIFTRQSPRAQVFHHLPYGDAASTAFPHIQVRGFVWGSEKGRNVINQVESQDTLYVRFGVDDVFRNGPVCGFNVCRYRPAFKEASSWNLCAGNGFVDATSFGHLWLHENPALASLDEARIESGRLIIEGRLAGAGSGAEGVPAGAISIELADPLDRRVRAKARIRNGRLSAALPWPKAPVTGRHRLYLHGADSLAEPGMFHFDLLPTIRARGRGRPADFKLGMFYDIPDDLRSTHFSPDRLAAELDLLRNWGVRRVSWIDYGPTDRSRSFWEWASSLQNARRTMAECGDVLPLAARQCREKGMTCYGVIKPFDMGFSEPEFDRPAPDRVLEVENRWAAVLDEVAANPSSVMTANPAWARPWMPPITRLRISSQSPLPPLDRADVELLVSDDNRRYAAYRGLFGLRQGTASVPHVRYTPAELLEEPGRRREHFLEFTGLALRARYAAIRFKRDGVCIEQRMFLAVQAFDAAGQPVGLMPSTGGSLESGLVFSKDWPGWANQTPRWISPWICEGRPLGMVFEVPQRVPQTLEPIDAAARAVWLAAVQRVIDAGCDGVDIRLLCVHHCCPDWLRYAFAAPVREAFAARYGRAVEAVEADYERVRLLRGEAVTQFLRDAKARTHAAGRKLVVHLECGIEVPPRLHTRMQLHLDWQRWIREGLADELMLKYWGSQSVWVHEQVLPLARQHGVPVHICDMNFTLSSPTGVERARRLAAEALAAGFAGYSFYETHSYLKLNPRGVPTVIGHADHAIRAAADVCGM